MSCCGKKRRTWQAEPPKPPHIQTRAPEQPPNPSRAVYFRYVGSTSLTVVGPVTRQVYTFPGSGSASATDPRDAPSIATVPNLVHINTL